LCQTVSTETRPQVGQKPGNALAVELHFQAFFEDLSGIENSKLMKHKENQKLIMIVKERQIQKILVN